MKDMLRDNPFHKNEAQSCPSATMYKSEKVIILDKENIMPNAGACQFDAKTSVKRKCSMKMGQSKVTSLKIIIHMGVYFIPLYQRHSFF